MVETRILDTDTFTLYRLGRRVLGSRIGSVPLSSLGVSVITVEEQFIGWQALLRRSKTDAQLAETYLRLTESVRALTKLHVFTLTESAVNCYRSHLTMKLNIGKMDLWIAAIALGENATVITRNLRDFQRIPGLKCENWAD